MQVFFFFFFFSQCECLLKHQDVAAIKHASFTKLSPVLCVTLRTKGFFHFFCLLFWADEEASTEKESSLESLPNSLLVLRCNLLISSGTVATTHDTDKIYTCFLVFV